MVSDNAIFIMFAQHLTTNQTELRSSGSSEIAAAAGGSHDRIRALELRRCLPSVLRLLTRRTHKHLSPPLLTSSRRLVADLTLVQIPLVLLLQTRRPRH